MTGMTVTEGLIFAATKVSTFKAGKPVGSGTGFFYDVPVGENLVANLLVTNRHVMAGANRMRITFHVRGESTRAPKGDVITWEFDISPYLVTGHPDPDVDLCAINIATALQEMHAQKGVRTFYYSAKRSNLPTQDDWTKFDAVEEVLMIGCPNGIFDQANNIPIVRKGITATSLTRRYNGREEFMVDMACFGGSSGSPVWLYDYDGHLDRTSGQFKAGEQRLFLLGVLYAGPVLTAGGDIISSQGDIADARVQIVTMMHLGYVIRATQIAVLEDHFLKLRAESVARLAKKKKS